MAYLPNDLKPSSSEWGPAPRKVLQQAQVALETAVPHVYDLAGLTLLKA